MTCHGLPISTAKACACCKSRIHDNLFGGGSIELATTGLTPLGIAGLAEMGHLGIVADISHASEQTALDVARHTRRPFILSHGAAVQSSIIPGALRTR